MNSPGPVPVQGAPLELSALSGEWAGRYWSKATGRRGTIRFSLPQQADTAFGEVEITFSPSLYLMRESTAKEDVSRKQPTVIDIRVVRVEADKVRGIMAGYWDPDCDCQAQSVFEGKIEGNRITGTFETQRGSSDRRILKGKWEALRKEGKP